jgi:phosphatidylglycerophosphate synthase
MNLPNIITLSRIPLMFVIVWLMYFTWPGAATLAFALFIGAAVGDWYDGRMVAASKGVVVAADSGGKTKTVTQLIALGFFLGAPMVSQDGFYLFHWDASRFVEAIGKVGVVVFVAGTALSVWSGYRYISRNARLVFGDESREQ